MNNIKVAIIEDVAEYRKALQLIINSTPNIKCVSSFPNGSFAIAEIPKMDLDIILVDINLPDINGIEVIRELKLVCPKLQFLVLTVYEEDEKILNALSAGASGYILKSTVPSKIIDAIVELHDGGSPMSSNIARKVVQYLNKSVTESNNPDESLLTKREREILNLLSTGLIYKQIADTLFISVETVKSHCHNIYDKLHVTTKMEAVNKYFKK
ncbi:MAG: response regulator transcription factor [Saprospiraceae bacterium]